MKIINVSKTPIIETPHKVAVRKLYDYDNAQAMHITLKPGETLKPHITPVDVFFLYPRRYRGRACWRGNN